jgi:chromosome partitioning protein
MDKLLAYTAKETAELLGVTPKALSAELKKDSYGADDLFDLRAKFKREPIAVGPRKQLFLNFKGGTGKTSLSTSYAWRLAEMGYNILLVDLDSQGHATKCLGYEGEDFESTLLNVLVKKAPISQVLQKSQLPNLDFIPSNLTMSTVDLALMPLAGREFKLRNALKEVESHYDFIIFDAPPSFGLLNLNALMATDDLIVPVLADFLSFHGLKLLFETVQSLEDDLQHVLDHVFIVVNAFNASFKLSKEAVGALKEHYPEYLMPQVIRQCTRFAQASSEGAPIFRFDRYSKGAQDVQALIDEVLTRLLARQKQHPHVPIDATHSQELSSAQSA